MALTKLTKDMDIIQKLGDEPNDVDGLSAAELKAKFDEGNNAMKQWVNDTFIPEVEKEIKASRLENLPEHAHTHAKDGRDPITPANIGFDHSAQEIDDAVARVAKDLPVGGAAPAGYGLGGETPATIANPDDAVNNGWYITKDPSTTSGTGWLHVSSCNSKYKRQDFYNSNVATGYHIVRYMNNGAWQPWEWLNPHMILGVEYRTTERYQGKPVYARTVDVGAVTANTQAMWMDTACPVECVVEAFAVGFSNSSETAYTTPYKDTALSRTFDCCGMAYDRVVKNRLSVFVDSTFDLDWCHATIKYTKETD